MRLPARAHAGVTIAEQVRAIDVLPTLTAIAGIPMGRVDGESVAGLIEGKTRRDPPSSYAETFYPKWHYGWSELKSIRGDRWKYIDAPKPELYDLRADPAERRNVAADRGTLVAGMSGELGKIAAGFGAAATHRRAEARRRYAGAPAQPRVRRHDRTSDRRRDAAPIRRT